nr:zinc finger, CCHC-type [Tanacetum cinerariifolium]
MDLILLVILTDSIVNITAMAVTTDLQLEPSKYFNLIVFTRLSDFCDHKFTTKIEVSVIMTNGEFVKDMTSKFDKLAKFEGQDFRRWQKKEELNLVQLGSHLRIEEGLRNQELDNNHKGKNQIGSSSVNMVERDRAKNSNNNKNKRKFKSDDDKFANKKGTMTCWKCKKTGHMKKDCRSHKSNDGVGSNGSKDPEKQKGYNSDFMLNFYNVLHYVSVISDAFYVQDDEVACHSNSLNKSELWHAKLRHVHYKRMRDMSKMSLIPTFAMAHESCKTCMLTKTTRQPFKGVNRESKVLDLIHSDLCDFHANPSLGHNKYVITFIDDAYRYCYVYLLHAKHEALDKFKTYKQEVKLQRQDLIKVLRTDRGGEYYDLVYFQSTGIIHQTMALYTPQQNGVAERKNMTLKKMVNSMLSYSGLSEGFWDSRDVIFDEEQFTSIPRPRGMIQPSSSKTAEDEVEGTDDVPGPSVPRKSTRTRKAKSFGSDFQLYLVERMRDKTLSQREYCFIIEEDSRTLSEAMAYRDVAFWKEEIQSEIDSIMHNGLRQKEEIDFFDTYARVSRISTIRLLLALVAIHDLVIHQMYVKTAFLNGDLDEKIYMKQPEGFVIPGHESKVCKLKKSLYGLKQAPKQWHQKFDDVVLSNGFSLNQADKCVYSKFDASGKGVIICLYVDDMLIFGTYQDQVNKTKEFLSSKFDMKDLGEAECFHNVRQRTITEFINLIKPHDLPFIVTEREHNCTRQTNDCVVMLVLEAFCIPSQFSEIQLFLIALNAELEVFNPLSNHEVVNVSVNVEFLMIKPPMRYTIRGTDVIGADFIDLKMLSQSDMYASCDTLPSGTKDERRLGFGVSGLSSSGNGFNHSGLYLIFGKWTESVSSESDILAVSGIASFYSSAVTRATNSESNELCCGGGGGRGRFVVVVVVVAVNIGTFVEDVGLRGERSMIGVDSGGIEEEA